MSNYGFIPAMDCGNKKLGKVNYTTAPPRNCPPTCVFKNNGCYAENAPMVWRWVDHQSGKSRHSVDFKQMLTKLGQIPRGDKIRLWVAGDFPTDSYGKPDCNKAVQIATRCIGKDAWTYTHHRPWAGKGNWGSTVRNLYPTGFVINISCESEDEVDAYIADGLKPAITVPSTETRKQWRTKAGNRVRVCPQQLHEGVTCEKCMLCHQRPDDMAIAFLSHGTRKKRVNSTLETIA